MLAGGVHPGAAAASWLWPGPRRGEEGENIWSQGRGTVRGNVRSCWKRPSPPRLGWSEPRHPSCATAAPGLGRERWCPVGAGTPAQVGVHYTPAPPLWRGETEARRSQTMQSGVAQAASAGVTLPVSQAHPRWLEEHRCAPAPRFIARGLAPPGASREGKGRLRRASGERAASSPPPQRRSLPPPPPRRWLEQNG